MATNKSIPAHIRKKLKQLYGKKPGVKVGDLAKIRKSLMGSAQIPVYSKDGGYIAKKRKKVVKKRKK
jgi:hypothetical protein